MNPTNTVMTDYVATRWYRAPEILLGSTRYTTGVDMWYALEMCCVCAVQTCIRHFLRSVGCILGELLSGKPVFPGTSTMNQLTTLLEVIGMPTKDDIASIKSAFATSTLETIVIKKSRSLQDMFRNAPPDALDLMTKLLQFNPDKRLSAEEALRHPYVAQFHDEADEPICPEIITIPFNDNVKYSLQEYREKLYQEMCKKKVETRKKHLVAAGSISVRKKDDDSAASTSGSAAPTVSNASPDSKPSSTVSAQPKPQSSSSVSASNR